MPSPVSQSAPVHSPYGYAYHDYDEESFFTGPSNECYGPYSRYHKSCYIHGLRMKQSLDRDDSIRKFTSILLNLMHRALQDRPDLIPITAQIVLESDQLSLNVTRALLQFEQHPIHTEQPCRSVEDDHRLLPEQRRCYSIHEVVADTVARLLACKKRYPTISLLDQYDVTVAFEFVPA